MGNAYKISVGSATDYDDLIAEIKFGSVAGVIVSKEPSNGDFMISLHSFSKDAAERFDYTRNIANEKISLSALLTALTEAKDRLERLG
tara:strand:- start:2225 stop:2488 length:264 start_codon:yes stop_codon:yes gene_type:complete